MNLILDKLAPAAEPPRLSRPRLLARLNNSLAAGTMTILNGRAGSGKTLLAADFARRCGRRVAWYKVEAADNEPRIFFQYLVTSIRRQRPACAAGWRSEWWARLTQAETTHLAEALVYELTEHPGEPLLLVVDDLHLVYDAEWVVRFFSRLAPLLPADVHLLILCRILPPAPLWRMRSKQTLSIIDEAALNFTLDEALKLCEGYDLNRAEALALYTQARGRALRLDCLAAARGAEKAKGKRQKAKEVMLQIG